MAVERIVERPFLAGRALPGRGHSSSRGRRVVHAATPFAGIATLLVVWQLLAASGRWSTDQLPGPWLVAAGARELLADGSLLGHVAASVARFAMAYALAVTAALPLGILLGLRPAAWRGVDPLVQILRPISPVAWFPLAVLWLGIGNLPAVAVIFVAAFYPVLLATVSAVRRVDPLYVRVARNFGTSDARLVAQVIVPAAFPQIAMGLRLAIGAAWVYLVAGEMLGARTGLGFLIVDARNFLRTDLVLVSMILVGLLGFVIDRAVSAAERRIDGRWGLTPEERS